MWKTPDGRALKPGKPFTMIQEVQRELFAWHYVSDAPLLDEETGEQLLDENGLPMYAESAGGEWVRVSVGFSNEKQEILWPASWHKMPDDEKRAIGLVYAPDPVKGRPPENFDPRFYRLTDGAVVEGVIEQQAVPLDLDVIKQRLHTELQAKIEFYRYQAEIEINDGAGGAIIMPAGERAIGLLSLARGRGLQGKVKLPIGGRRHQVTQEDIDAIDGALLQYQLAVGTRGYDLGEAIDAAETFDQIRLVDIDADWPAVHVPDPDSGQI